MNDAERLPFSQLAAQQKGEKLQPIQYATPIKPIKPMGIKNAGTPGVPVSPDILPNNYPP